VIPLVFTDAELEQLADDYGGFLGGEVGFQFVDVKACHGYLLHEFLCSDTLGVWRRPGGRSVDAFDHRSDSGQLPS
jgi:hypothetical protein